MEHRTTPRTTGMRCRGKAPWRLALVALSAVMFTTGCASDEGGSAATRTSLPAGRPQPFAQDVPASTEKFEMRPVPGGTVRVSDAKAPGRSREVRVAALWFSKTEVTWDAYDVFLLRLDIPEARRTAPEADPGPDAVTRPTPPYAPPDRGWGHAGYPVIGVTFYAAQAYCAWLSEKTGRAYRLPTVAEWRHACEAGADDATPLAERAWFADNADERTHRVADRKPNGMGLFDLLGNAGEWCVDESGKGVLCGGSFESASDEVGCAAQMAQTPAWNASDPSLPRSKWWLRDAPFAGFRVVCEAADRKR